MLYINPKTLLQKLFLSVENVQNRIKIKTQMSVPSNCKLDVRSNTLYENPTTLKKRKPTMEYGYSEKAIQIRIQHKSKEVL